MSATVSDLIYELRQAASYAALNYEIWWAYKSSDTRPIYASTMNRYSPLFQTAIHAHFLAMITALYRIYETRKDSHNFENLLRCLVSEICASDADIAKYRGRHDRLKPVWIKISKLRNQAFGHRTMQSSIQDVFRAVAITGDEFREFIRSTAQ